MIRQIFRYEWINAFDIVSFLRNESHSKVLGPVDARNTGKHLSGFIGHIIESNRNPNILVPRDQFNDEKIFYVHFHHVITPTKNEPGAKL